MLMAMRLDYNRCLVVNGQHGAVEGGRTYCEQHCTAHEEEDGKRNLPVMTVRVEVE